MKKILFSFVALLGISVSAQLVQPTSGTTQTSPGNGAFLFTLIPLTNQSTFINTFVPPTNGASLQLPDVVKLLLTLQTNIETALPVLDFIQTNAGLVSLVPTNIVQGFFTPMTSIPPPLGFTPTGADQPVVTSLSVLIGTNNFDIDAATLQALFVLRNGLQQTLPVLQSLNGTSPSQTNALIASPSFFNPGVTNFVPNPITNPFASPLTNMTPF